MDGHWFKLHRDGSMGEIAAPTSRQGLKKAKWRNEKEIEKLLVVKPDLLGEPLLIIDQERAMRAVPDLVALDSNGRVVLIEIKDERVADHQAAGQVAAYWAMYSKVSEMRLRRRFTNYREKDGLPLVDLEVAFEEVFGSPLGSMDVAERQAPRAVLVCEECKHPTKNVFDAVATATHGQFEASIAWFRRWTSGRQRLLHVVVPAMAESLVEEQDVKVGDVLQSVNPDGQRYVVLNTDYKGKFILQRIPETIRSQPPRKPEIRSAIDHHYLLEDDRVSWGDYENYTKGCHLTQPGKPRRELTFMGADGKRGYFLRFEPKKGSKSLKWKPLSDLGGKYRLVE